MTRRSHITPEGYRKVYAPDHPNANQGYIFEHRLIVSEHIGRALRPREVVHHINGDRLDNRIENLELHASQQEHFRAHWADRTRCDRGHALTPENTILRPYNGWRTCKQCKRDRDQATRDANIAAGLTSKGKPRKRAK